MECGDFFFHFTVSDGTLVCLVWFFTFFSFRSHGGGNLTLVTEFRSTVLLSPSLFTFVSFPSGRFVKFSLLGLSTSYIIKQVSCLVPNMSVGSLVLVVTVSSYWVEVEFLVLSLNRYLDSFLGIFLPEVCRFLACFQSSGTVLFFCRSTLRADFFGWLLSLGSLPHTRGVILGNFLLYWLFPLFYSCLLTIGGGGAIIVRVVQRACSAFLFRFKGYNP